MKNVLLASAWLLLAVNLHYAESKRMSLEQIRDALKPVRDICIERVGVKPKLIDDANLGKFEPDRKLKCYYKCMMLMTKAMKNDEILGEHFVKVVQTMVLEELVDPILEGMVHCAPITMKPLDGCDLAYELSKCYYDYDPNLRFYP